MKNYSGDAILFSSFRARSVLVFFQVFPTKKPEMNDKLGLIYI